MSSRSYNAINMFLDNKSAVWNSVIGGNEDSYNVDEFTVLVPIIALGCYIIDHCCYNFFYVEMVKDVVKSYSQWVEPGCDSSLRTTAFLLKKSSRVDAH